MNLSEQFTEILHSHWRDLWTKKSSLFALLEEISQPLRDRLAEIDLAAEAMARASLFEWLNNTTRLTESDNLPEGLVSLVEVVGVLVLVELDVLSKDRVCMVDSLIVLELSLGVCQQF